MSWNIRIDTTDLAATFENAERKVTEAANELSDRALDRYVIEYAAAVVTAKAKRDIVARVLLAIRSCAVANGNMEVIESDSNGYAIAWAGVPTKHDVLAAIGRVRRDMVGNVMGTALRPLSRSTSIPSNLTEDLENAARAEFAYTGNYSEVIIDGEWVSDREIQEADDSQRVIDTERAEARRAAEAAENLRVNGHPTDSEGNALDGRKVARVARNAMKEMGYESNILLKHQLRGYHGSGVGVDFNADGRGVVLIGYWSNENEEAAKHFATMMENVAGALTEAGYMVQPTEGESWKHTARVTGFRPEA